MRGVLDAKLGAREDGQQVTGRQGATAKVEASDHRDESSEHTRHLMGETRAVNIVPIKDASIRLGQFLKLADLAESGAQATELIADGEVGVNGEAETRRGRQLVPGDVVVVASPHGSRTAQVGGSGS